MTKTKNKKDIAKRQAKAGQRKSQKRKQRLQQKAQQPRTHSAPARSQFAFPHEPDLTGVEAPRGYRTVNLFNAIMDFGRSLVGNPHARGLTSFDSANTIAMSVMEYAIALEEGRTAGKLRTRAIDAIRFACSTGVDEAEMRLDQLVVKKRELFPPEIQPEDRSIMFIRNRL